MLFLGRFAEEASRQSGNPFTLPALYCSRYGLLWNMNCREDVPNHTWQAPSIHYCRTSGTSLRLSTFHPRRITIFSLFLVSLFICSYQSKFTSKIKRSHITFCLRETHSPLLSCKIVCSDCSEMEPEGSVGLPKKKKTVSSLAGSLTSRQAGHSQGSIMAEKSSSLSSYAWMVGIALALSGVQFLCTVVCNSFPSFSSLL